MYGLGIGPGDPDLITLKALRILQAVPIIAYPAPETGDSLARHIVSPHLTGEQEEIVIRTPMSIARFPAQEIYDRAAEEIGSRLETGSDIAVLCEGDPFFYGSFMYLFARMSEQHSVEVIPGVSSLMACATTLGMPLASRNDVLTILPATLSAQALTERLRDVEAVAIIKVGRHFDKVRNVLEALDLSSKAHYVEHATMPSQKIASLEAVDPQSVPYFSMILVHKRGAAWRV